MAQTFIANQSSLIFISSPCRISVMVVVPVLKAVSYTTLE